MYTQNLDHLVLKVLLALCVLLSPFAHAEETFAISGDMAAEHSTIKSNPQTIIQLPSAPEIGPQYYIKTILMLLLVLAVIFVMVYLFAMLQRGMGGQGRGMKVIAQLPLSTKERIVLVKIGEKAMLIGVTPGRIEALHFFTDIPKLEAEADNGDFGQVLQQWYKKVRHAS